MKRSFLLSATLAVVSTVGSTARADSSNVVATAAFRDGREALKAGKYDVACAKFRVSEDAEPSSGARLNLGDCALRRSEYVEAEKLYRGAALLTEGEKRAFAEQRAVAARALAGTLRIRWARSKPAAGRVEVDDKVIEVPGEVALNPGRHVIRTVARGYPDAPQSVVIASGSTAQIDLAEIEAPAIASPRPESNEKTPPRNGSRSRSPVSFVLMGLGGVAIAGGVVTGLVAMGARDDLDSKCGGQKPCAADVFARDDVRADYDKAKSWALVSTVSFVGGAIALVAGGTLWLVTAPSPGGQTVSLAGRF